MRRLAALLIFLALAVPAAAQEAAPLAVGRAVDAVLEAGDAHAYALDLPAEQFVSGTVRQTGVDAVVTIRDPDGALVDRFDGPARGAEPFAFETETAGVYTIEVTPFEDGAGGYTIALARSEPAATAPEGRIDQLIAGVAPAEGPGGVVAVVRGGEVAYARAFGLADLAHEVPFTPETRTNIGSTSKQFTAFAVALLAERGEIDLDADVRTYLPELPDLGAVVTVRHLLTHTSGYREFLNTLALAGRSLAGPIDREELVAIVQRQPELQNEPGARWNYNNTGYGLLARLVERVADTPFPEWMDAHVFTPLGMHDTVVRAHPGDVIPHAADGYAPTDDGFRAVTDLGGAMGAGGIYTTVGDLARWMGNLATGAVGGPAVRDALTTRYVLSSGDTTSYGLGLFIDELRGQRRWHHGGADAAHRSTFEYYPDLDAGLIVLVNHPTFDGPVAERMAEAFFGDALEALPEEAAAEPAAAFDPAAFDAAVFDAYAGRYALEAAPNFILAFRRDGDRFVTQATGQPEVEIVPTSDSTFAVQGVPAAVTFHRGADGRVRSITLHQGGDHAAHRLDDAEPLDLTPYAGRYYSDELEAFYTLAVEDDALVARHRRLDDVALTHNDGDAFTGGFPLAEVAFERNDAGRVTGFHAGNGRTRDVWFERVDAD